MHVNVFSAKCSVWQASVTSWQDVLMLSQGHNRLLAPTANKSAGFWCSAGSRLELSAKLIGCSSMGCGAHMLDLITHPRNEICQLYYPTNEQ